MLNKKIIVSFLLFVFLLIVLFLCIQVNNSASTGNSFFSSVISPKDTPCFIELQDGFSETLLLKKTPHNDWIVKVGDNYFPCSEESVNTFVSILKEKILFTPISEKQSTWSQYGLTDELAFQVKLFDENYTLLAELFFGYEQATKNNISFRSGRDISSFSIENKIGFYLEDKIAYWSNLDIFSKTINPDFVQEVSLLELEDKKIKSKSSLIKKNKLWQLKNSLETFDIDLKSISSRFLSLSSIRAIEPNLEKMVFENLSLKYCIQLFLGNGEQDTINIYLHPLENDLFILKRTNQDWSYIISNFALQKILNVFTTSLD